MSGSKNRIIFVQGAGSITLKNCNFQTSSTNYNTTIDSSAIVVHGTSGAKAGQIILEKVKASTGTTRTTLCGVNYGTLKIIDSELSVNGVGYHCIKSTSGAQVEIKGSSLYTANSEDNTYSCYYITGQTNAKITIEGSYLYSESGVCIRDHSYAQAITINSGYFNCDVSTTSSNVKYAEGVNKSDCSEKHTHAGKEYTYTWKVTK